MTTFLVLAVLCLCGMSIWGVKVITANSSSQSTPAWAFMGVSIAIALKIILAMLQTEFARRDIRAGQSQMNQKMDEVVKKTNGGLTRAVHEAAEEVRTAEREQYINNPEEAKKLAAALCPMLAKEIAEELRKQQPPSVQT